MIPLRLRILSMIPAFFVLSAAALAQDPCAAFSWNVSHERALFAATAQGLTAGGEATSAPSIVTEKLYELALSGQEQVHFRVTPAKQARTAGTFAGMVRLRLSNAGLYRISGDQPFWIDVVDGELPVQSVDYQGRPGCEAPHKIVQFRLPAGRDLTLQISGSVRPSARMAVTRAPTDST